jgi:hypothetical protein
MVAVIDSSLEQATLWLLTALCSVLIGMLIYIWKSALADIRERIDSHALRIKDLEKTFVSKEDFEKSGKITIHAVREAQAQLLNLSERITTFMLEIPQEFAKEDNCRIKHQGLEIMVSQVQNAVNQSILKLDQVGKTLDDVRLWQGRAEERHKIETGTHASK